MCPFPSHSVLVIHINRCKNSIKWCTICSQNDICLLKNRNSGVSPPVFRETPLAFRENILRSPFYIAFFAVEKRVSKQEV